MRFYLTNSSTTKNIINILETGILSPGGGTGMITHNNIKSEYLYFELVFPELKRAGPGNGIYFDYNILKDYDFYWLYGWVYINNNKNMGNKFPKKNVYKKLKLLEDKYIKYRNEYWLDTEQYPPYGYQFVTKSSIPIQKYIRFVSNPIYTHPFKIKKEDVKEKSIVGEKNIIKILKNKYPNATILNYYDKLNQNDIPRSPKVDKWRKEVIEAGKILQIGKK